VAIAPELRHPNGESSGRKPQTNHNRSSATKTLNATARSSNGRSALPVGRQSSGSRSFRIAFTFLGFSCRFRRRPRGHRHCIVDHRAQRKWHPQQRNRSGSQVKARGYNRAGRNHEGKMVLPLRLGSGHHQRGVHRADPLRGTVHDPDSQVVSPRRQRDQLVSRQAVCQDSVSEACATSLPELSNAMTMQSTWARFRLSGASAKFTPLLSMT